MNRIVEMQEDDWSAAWEIIRPVFRQGDTYVFEKDISEDEAKGIWFASPEKTFVCLGEQGEMLGTYYLKKNQPGSGSHVCNCGYIVGEAARGKGVASQMCEHSQVVAQGLGYKAMQFNFVVASNTGAIKLWEKLGFDVIGVIPKGFSHPDGGYVDAKIMYKWLSTEGG